MPVSRHHHIPQYSTLQYNCRTLSLAQHQDYTNEAISGMSFVSLPLQHKKSHLHFMYKTERKVFSAASHNDTGLGERLKVWLHSFLASAPDGGWAVSLKPSHFAAGKETPVSTEEEDCRALTAALDIWEQTEIFCCCQESNSSPSSSY